MMLDICQPMFVLISFSTKLAQQNVLKLRLNNYLSLVFCLGVSSFLKTTALKPIRVVALVQHSFCKFQPLV